MLPLLPFVAGGVTALKPIEHKALSAVCRQNSKVYISETSDVDSLAHTENFSDVLIDEFGKSCSQVSESYQNWMGLVPDELFAESEKMAADEMAQWQETKKDIGFGKTATPSPQTHTGLENQAATNGNKRQHLENFNRTVIDCHQLSSS